MLFGYICIVDVFLHQTELSYGGCNPYHALKVIENLPVLFLFFYASTIYIMINPLVYIIFHFHKTQLLVSQNVLILVQ